MKTFFITGIKGFIGTYLANLIHQNGYKVKGIDNLSNSCSEKLNPEIEFKKADILRKSEYIDFMKGSDYVLHLAAMSRSGPSVGKDLFCLEQNVYGTQLVLEAAISNGVNRIIYSASSTYYGSSLIPNKVNDPPDFLNSYGITKYLGEEIIRKCSINKIEYNILRLFNVFGPGQPKTGNYALVFGIFLDQKKKSIPLNIHGDGNQSRDFIHVQDVSNAFLNSCLSKINGRTFNVGSGKNISIKKLAKLISNDLIYTDRRSNDAMHTLADITQTRELLNWEVKIEPINSINKMIKEELST